MTTEGNGLPSTEGADRAIGEVTVELKLTAAEQLELSRAGERTFRPPQTAPDNPGYDTLIYTRTRRADAVATITFAVVACGIITAAGWHAFTPESEARAPTLASSVPPAPPAVEQPQPALVQVVNPFDATEVFELPPEISQAEARSVIAELLLQRARERRQDRLALNHVGNHHSRRVAEAKPAEVFVTKVLSPVNRFADAPGPRSGTGVAE